MTFLISADSLPLRTDDFGVVRIANTRVSLDSVVFDYKNGATAEQIAYDYPTLNLADIHAVIAYYLRHEGEVEVYLADQQLQAEKVRKLIEPAIASGQIRERLLARRNNYGRNNAANHDG